MLKTDNLLSGYTFNGCWIIRFEHPYLRVKYYRKWRRSSFAMSSFVIATAVGPE